MFSFSRHFLSLSATADGDDDDMVTTTEQLDTGDSVSDMAAFKLSTIF